MTRAPAPPPGRVTREARVGDGTIEQGAAFIVRHCMRVRAGEEVLIVSDDRPPQLRIAGALRRAGEVLGARASIGVMAPLGIAGDEPPRAIAGAMKHADAIAVVVERVSLGHTRARLEANEAGARVFTMPEVTEQDMGRALRPDLQEIRACSETWAERFTRARTVRATERLARALLEKVGLADKMTVKPGQLSGGQQQRVAIARALAMDPKVMLFDEVTSALDPELVGEVLTVMKKLADDSMTMVVVTHEMHFAQRVADRVVMLDHGTIVEQGPPGKIFAKAEQERTRRFLNQLQWEGA